MKTSITYLGIALVAFTNVALALNCQQSFINDETSLTESQLLAGKNPVTVNEDHSGDWKSNKETGKHKNGDPSDVIVFRPYEKSFQEIVEANNQIIENAASSERYLSSTEDNLSEEERIIESINSMKSCLEERTIEEIIIENHKITESALLSEALSNKLGKTE
ncbi:hypothetical protein ABGT15_12885 [Flavobacterium enshiense]|uniref:hypothetical protein n=1 Tax=Flavobacterium enshiense TaxID=1341165 RepID=UPI00345DB85E